MFELESEEDLGILYAIELKFCDCLSKANDLDLKKVEIVHNEETFTFENNQVISVKDPNEVKYIKKILLENNAQFF